MILKHLEMVGFKSFVDETRLDFTKGFTAIVGPNGCGKSNISDAVRWVIGEQSTRHLRGTKITDLIFNGTESRKAVNRAEINLVIGDVPQGIRIANVPHIGDEIKVTRCCHRSGESEYYINQIPCRLKDIIDLFLDLGISTKSMTIIEQNHIQQIVTGKPEERRYLIEEAAGILKFKHRKHEAQLKLAASQQNLLRIADIVQELGRQAESLKRQAAKADRYKRLQADIKDLTLNLYSRKTRAFRLELEKLAVDHGQSSERKTLLAARASELENLVESLKMAIDETQGALNAKKEEIHKLTTQIGKNEHMVAMQQAEIKRATQDTEAAAQEISRMQGEIAKLIAETAAQRSELGNVSEDIGAKEIQCETLMRDFNSDKERLREKEEQAHVADANVMDLHHRISRRKNEITALQTRTQFLRGREEKLRQELAETCGKVEETRTLVAGAETVLDEKTRLFESLKAHREELTQNRRECKANLTSEAERLAVAKGALLTENALLNSMKELRRKFEGFQSGVQSLMGGNSNGGRLPGLREVLVDVLQAPAEYELAVAAVLGEKLQSVIVNSYSDSVEAIGHLRSHHSGRGSFIPMQPKGALRSPLYLNGNSGVVGKITDLIRCREEYKSVIEHLLGNVVVVDNLETALYMHALSEFNGVVVTQNGEVIDIDGMVSGGEGDEKSSSLLSQKREIESLTVKVAGLEHEMTAVQAVHEEFTRKFAEIEETLTGISAETQKTEISRADCRRDVEQLQKELRRLEEKSSTLDYEGSAGTIELQKLITEEQRLQGGLTVDEAEKNRQEAWVVEFRATLKALREALEAKTVDIGSIRELIASLKGKREVILSEIKRHTLQQEHLELRVKQREQDIQANAAKIDGNRQAVEVHEKQIMTFAREKEGLSEQSVQDEEALREKEEDLEQKEIESKSHFKQFQELSDILSKLELKQSEIKIQSAHLEEQAYEDFNVTLEEMLAQYAGNVDEAETADTLRDLKEKVAKVGEVNLAALSEFQLASERYTFLKKQQDDLAESIKTLNEAIEKIDGSTRQRFLETFHQVDERFRAIYARLFRGGKAQLVLCDEADPLESGIEIIAQPAGKKMQHLSLLSGGEKAMTAISLVFALLKVRPTPFCLLDEVDAPLDEANVVRFQEMLREMSDKTQFIIITHNQRTMSFANALYGVTMEERGVSKLVSVHLN